MSIQTELTRITNAKAAIKTAIEGKGVTVPDGTMLDGMASLIESIEAGDAEIYSGSITPTVDASTIGVEVSDPSKHINGEKPLMALLVNVTNFEPGNYITAIGVVNGVAFRHIGKILSEYTQYDEKYMRGAVPTSDEVASRICVFYGVKTWFYSSSLQLILGSSSTVTAFKMFKAGTTYNYYIVY